MNAMTLDEIRAFYMAELAAQKCCIRVKGFVYQKANGAYCVDFYSPNFKQDKLIGFALDSWSPERIRAAIRQSVNFIKGIWA